MNWYSLPTALKITSAVFITTTIFCAVKLHESYKENTKLKSSIAIDKKTYASDLSEIFSRFDSEVLKNKNLLDSFSIKNLQNYHLNKVHKPTVIFKKITSHDSHNDFHIQTIDSLIALLADKHSKNLELLNKLEILTQTNNDLNKKESNYENLIANTPNLTATNVFANGIKIVSNNIIETKKFSNTEQIKVCFTLLENNAALKGNKDIYIQIINPKNKVVSQFGDYIEIEDKSLYYSAKTNVYYENQELDVCVFVASNKADIQKGDYEINIFSGAKIIANTTFYLK